MNERLNFQSAGAVRKNRPERSAQFWVGSNGNLFCDSSKFRYCIMQDDKGYRIARDGNPIGHELSLAEVKLRVTRSVRDDI